MVTTRSSAARVEAACRVNGIAGHINKLPNELLNIIFQQVQDDDLLKLSCLSTSLHSIALPMYLVRVGFHGSTLHLGDSPRSPFKILKGIRLSFALSGLDILECMFGADDVQIIEQLKEVRKLLQRLPAVSTLRFCFDRAVWFVGSQAFTKEFYRSINALDGKNCNCLQIIDPPTSPPVANLKLRPIDTLTDVTISLLHFIRTPEVDWIVQSLNQSPVRALKLTIADTDTVEILNRATLPHLDEFHVSCNIPIDWFIPFLHRHPNITILHAGLTGNTLPQTLHMCTLPRLTTLIAPPRLIISFLSLPGRVPIINTICMFMDQLIPDELTRALASLSTYPDIHTLTLNIWRRYTMEELQRYMEVEDNAPHSAESKPVLPHITHFTLLSEIEVIHLLPNWLRVLFPNMETFIFEDGPITNRLLSDEKTVLVRKLRETCTALQYVSFSRNSPTQPVARFL